MPEDLSGFDFHSAFDGVFRESYGRVAAALAKEFRDLELSEDALQEALTVAARRWPREGIPDNAAGWLYVVARRKAIDALRRFSRQSKRALSSARHDPPHDSGMSAMYGVSGPPDERLSLIFACCHPVINEPAQVALTLHTLTALSTAEIAAGFLQKEATVAQRIVRAKQKIKKAGIPFAIPDIENSPERLAGVLSVIYLIFNAGYTAHSGQALLKTNLCDETVFLARMLVQLLPEHSEIEGLLALLLFQDARREARVAADGSPVLLADQDRTTWDRAKIEEGMRHLQGARSRSEAGFYQTQAEIAAVHALSPRAEDTRWPDILRHYDRLLAIYPSPVVHLNRAVALKQAVGPDVALHTLEESGIGEHLDSYHYYHATRGEMLLDLGRNAEAKQSFARAWELAGNTGEQAHLERRMAVAEEGVRGE